MKHDKRQRPTRVWLSQFPGPRAHRDQLLEAGYPRFLFRLAAARRAWPEAAVSPRRHD